ncbi:MAG: MAPEG family protein [Pseudomonadota bacterium]
MSELLPLSLLILVQLILGLGATLAVGKAVGLNWLYSSRSENADYRNSLGGRLDRARNNGFEALILFAPLCLLFAFSGSSTTSTVLAAWVFLVARCAYWLCYAADLVPWRTIVWFVGWFALVYMAIVAGLSSLQSPV